MIRIRSAALVVALVAACNPTVNLEERGCPCLEGYQCREGKCVIGTAAAPVAEAPSGEARSGEGAREVPPQISVANTQFAELNGDGKIDRIERTFDNAFWVSLGIAAGYGPRHQWMKHGGDYESDDQAKYADLNADGKDDLIMQGVDNRFWVSLSTGAGLRTPENWVTHGVPYVVGQARYEDLNGDRKADLLFRGVDGIDWVSYSTGSSFTAPVVWTPN